MSIMSYNGAGVVAMAGKECVAIAADKRLGVQFQTVSTDFQKVFEMGSRLFIGLPGLATDVQTVYEKAKFRVNMYELRENRKIKPATFASLIANMLYEKRFGPYFVEPIIAGLEPKTFEPFLATMDLIGCKTICRDFVVGGTCADQLYGMCEVLWEPNLEPDDLFETVSQALLNAMDRDAYSGWGADVYVIERDQVTMKTLKGRMD